MPCGEQGGVECTRRHDEKPRAASALCQADQFSGSGGKRVGGSEGSVAASKPLAIPFDDADVTAISEQTASTESDLQSAGTHIFSDKVLTRIVERLGDRIDTWAREMSKKGGGKKKGARGAGGGKAGKFTGSTRDEPTVTVVGVPAEILEEWVIATEIVPDDIMDDVLERIGAQVDDKVRARLTELAASQQNAAAQSQKKSLAVLQQKAQSLYASICMFETASSSFPDSLRDELRQYLLRTAGTELANAALSCASGTENAGQLKEKQREETIAALPTVLRDVITALFNSLRGDDLDAFHSAVFDLSSPSALSISLKQPDSRTRSEVLEGYVGELKEQVLAQTEPAAVLLSCVLYLLAKNGKPVTASGRFVAQLVPQLDGVIDQVPFGRF
ncbi:unnamed protein product [Heligmosomoides polygyrus]|uniref:E3 UFM1-protein ligase 1 homolog n=1 Tax=Heligmosomoides polygyrus TaxID=6339 RepID=A0A183F5U3_HELPZ|nr:unnamed protein product [Heligmosomoides polygyrus]